MRKEWNASALRYVDFWDLVPVFLKFASQPMPLSIEGVRLRLILAWRFLGLFRSVDLSRAYRTVAIQDGKTYIRVRRKGKREARFERVMDLPGSMASPLLLLQTYLALTKGQVGEREPLLCALMTRSRTPRCQEILVLRCPGRA